MAWIKFFLTFLSVGFTSSANFPNELDGYHIFQSANWNQLKPLVSDMKDVRALLGNPNSAKDIANYSKPYPGDDSAIEPVWEYDSDSTWLIIIYFVKSGYPQSGIFPKSLGNKLYSIDLLPKRKITIDRSRFKHPFAKNHVLAADAAWDDYSDKSGLVYSIYTGMANKKISRNQLSRISYGPSDHVRDSIVRQSKSH